MYDAVSSRATSIQQVTTTRLRTAVLFLRAILTLITPVVTIVTDYLLHLYHQSVGILLNPTSSFLLEPHQYSCCSQDKFQEGKIVSTLKILFPPSSMSSSLYFRSYPPVTLPNVSTLLMPSFLVMILLSTVEEEVEQVSLHKSIPIGGKHCVQTDIFYIFISILWLRYFAVLSITFGPLETTIQAQYSSLLGSLQ